MSDQPRQQRTDAPFVRRFVRGSELLTLLVLHGTGGNENDMLPTAEIIRPAANVLSLRGKVLENGMPRFFRRLAEGVFDLPDLIFRTNELADFLPKAAEEFRFDPSRVVAVGYSNGANIAASSLLLRPGLLAGAILLRPMVPLVPEALPKLDGLPVFIAAGKHDSIVPTTEPEQLSALLQKAGAKVTVSWQEGGHGLNSRELQTAREWLAGIYPPPR